jgi:hypothetical protein
MGKKADRSESTSKIGTNDSSSTGNDIYLEPGHTDGVTQSNLSDEEKERRLKLVDNVQIVSPSWAGNLAGTIVSEYEEHLKNIALTDEGAEMLAKVSGTIKVVICNFCNSESKPNNVVQIGLKMSGGQNRPNYTKATGINTFVKLTGMRTLAHELTHNIYQHSGSNAPGIVRMNETGKTGAMRVTNIIMKQHYGSLAGERINYSSIEHRKLPINAIVKY